MKETIASRNAALQGRIDDLASGRISLRTGEIQADITVALAGTELASIPFDATPFAAPSNGSVALADTPINFTGSADGICGHAVIVESGDDGTGAPGTTLTRIFLDVSESGGGGDLIIDNENIGNGQDGQITALTLTQPE